MVVAEAEVMADLRADIGERKILDLFKESSVRVLIWHGG